MDILTRAYAGLVKKGSITIDRIPEEYREAVSNYNPDLDKPDPEEPVEEVYGALTLNSMHLQYSGEPIAVDVSHLFTTDKLGEQPAPTNLRYTLQRVENAYGKFLDTVNCTINATETGFTINIDGTPVNLNTNQNILRIDLIISSDNYEDMVLSIYIMS